MASLLTGLKDFFFRADNPFLATVAIDLGTAYSGFAYSLNKNQGEDAIFMNRDWVNELGHRTSKTPTCLLLKPDRSFDSFGYKAVERYAYFRSVYEAQDVFLFFELSKKDLHNDKILDLDSTLTATNGRVVRAITVFAHCIKYLKDEAIACIGREVGEEGLDVKNVHWVFTVPASWAARSKQFMREAAYEAGIGSRGNPRQLMIVSEAEAARQFCVRTEIKLIALGTEAANLDETNTAFLLVDIGGGSLAVTVFVQHDDGTVVEIDKETCASHDAFMTNRHFEELLKKKFGNQKLNDYCQLFPNDWLQIMQSFEAKKCAFQNDETMIHLPGSFVASVNDFLSPSMKLYGDGEVKIVDDEYLCLSPKCMLTLFEPFIETVTQQLKALVRKRPLSTGMRRTMLLAGGCAESLYLQEEIKKEFSGSNNVMTPLDASLAVVKGAVMVAQATNAAKKPRIVGASYGADCSRNFVRGQHPPEKKFLTDGKEKCRDLFNCFVNKNDIIKHGQKISLRYRPREANETEIKYTFYASDHPNAVFVTERGVTEIGSIVIHSPSTRKGLDRDILVSMYFGETEVIASAWDVSSGNRAQTTLDVSPPF